VTLLAALVPTWLDLAGFAGVLFAGAVMMLCGRVLTGAKTVPELELAAGWGGYSLLLTLWGVVTTATMLIPTVAALLVAAAALARRRWRPGRESWVAILRMLALALPIWAIMVAAKPALPDTFTNFLPNAVYLHDHAFFPADDRAHAFAVWPAFPYNVQLATYLGSFFLPTFPPGALTLFNILLQVMTGLLFARLLAQGNRDFAAAPSWGAAAAGLLLVTLLNPGFVPRIDFTAYAEPSLSVCVLLLGWLACRILGRMAARQGAGPDLRLFALILVALVGVKQVGVVLGFGIVAGAAALALLDRRIARAQAIGALIAASVPALLLYGAWRAYVLTHFQSGELKLLPEADWQFGILPITLANMLHEIVEKPVFFGSFALAVGLGLALARREGLTRRTRPPLLLAGLFLLYNAFLLLIYVIHMGPVAGEAAHSYFRYMTHLSLLIVLALAIFARDWWRARETAAPPFWRRALPGAAIALILLAPAGFAKRLRFDIDPPQPLVWALARDVAGTVKNGDKLALLLPGDNGSVSLMLRAALELTPPRRRDLDILDVSAAADGLELAARRGYRRALVSCTPTEAAPGPGAASLLAFDGTEWRPVQRWAYPAMPAKERWTSVLAAAPFCRGTTATAKN